jgi:hypothetical protein
MVPTASPEGVPVVGFQALKSRTAVAAQESLPAIAYGLSAPVRIIAGIFSLEIEPMIELRSDSLSDTNCLTKPWLRKRHTLKLIRELSADSAICVQYGTALRR